MGRPICDMSGKRIGQLTVIDKVGAWDKQIWWRCKCDCGNEKVISGATLRRGKTKSCGCIYKATRKEIAHKSIAKVKHGGSYERLYFVWSSMKARCNYANDINYKNYGGRGIKVCPEWEHDYSAFRDWAIKNGYDSDADRNQCTLDRIDPDAGYSPENCRWVNFVVQSNNRRNTPTITVNGVTHTAAEWSRITGIPRNTIYQRYRAGWEASEIITPVEQHRRRICEPHYTQESQQLSRCCTD